MKRTFITLIMLLFFISCHFIQNIDQDKQNIVAVLHQQELAWNEGNLEKYMSGYWHSDQLVFVGTSELSYGWQKNLESYKAGYPDKAAMGHLSFEVVALDVNNDTAFMLGKWKLQRAKDAPGGFFSLYWKKIDGKWVIAVDHTT